MKLSEAQRRLLREVANGTTNTVVDHYKPGRKLWELGLIDRDERPYGQLHLSITPAGLKALEEK